ncbi:glycoside hydrolase family 18 protein [Paenibacillus contaminans]|uniref:Spore gernimation protein n=1 Tax=Paenibacillus contaminans TaxID=450362 RepID=A0A329MLD7_9BACL|nr:glycoside hydrolase family 18 protein [Paenibacillus contaminans]RAV18687.1 spore gernimation protein [Paenibacillus contaminans]
MHIEVVRPGDSVWAIARRYGVTPASIMEANGIDNPQRLVIGQALLVPTVGSFHTVRPGESLWSIARLYGVSEQDIRELNPQINFAQLQPGMVIRIPSPPRTTIEVNSYLQPTGSEQDAARVKEAAPHSTYISMFSYRVTREGDLIAPRVDQALAAMKDTRAVPMMVLTNFEEGTFSGDIGAAVLRNESVRSNLIRNVLNVMKDKGYYALNIDFEHLYPEDRERYNDFLREITRQAHLEGHLVSTALAPKTSAAQAGQWYEAHDYAAHGRIVDFVIIMTYEWGWSGGPPMAVAPIPQVRRVLEYALTVIPPQKIMMGAPLYGYDWTLPYVKGGKFARTLGIDEAVAQAARVNAAIQYDYTSQAPHYSYFDRDGKEHVVWFEDARSMQAKFNLIKEYGLRGISYWVLGKPFTANWVLLESNFKIKSYR